MLNKIVDSTLKNQYLPSIYHTMAFEYHAVSNKYHTVSKEIAIRALKVPFGAFGVGVTRLE
jgi:hypothetical protein